MVALSSLRTKLGSFARPTEAGREWRRVRLGSVMQQAADPVTVTPDRSYRNVGILSFGRGLFEKPEIDGRTTSAKTLFRIRGGQFIYSRLFAFEGAYAWVTPEFDGYCVSNEFPTFDTDPSELDAEWLSIYLRSPDRWLEIAASSKGLGVRRQRVPVEAILDFAIPLPPIDTQRAMVRIVNEIDALIRARAAADDALAALVPAALNAAFSETRLDRVGVPTSPGSQ